jgi:23S rRNA-/tRNA-specific pseudouridylate synthase
MKRFSITGEWHGSRLDRFIRASFPGTPFGVTQILLRKGLIFLNGTKALGNSRLKAGDVVAVDLAEFEESGRPAPAPPPRSKRATRIGRDIPVLYEDDAIIVLDKPAGLVVQPGNQKQKGSLLDLLEEYRRKKTGARPGMTTARRNQDERQIQLDLRSPDEVASADSSDAGPPGIHFPYTPVHRLDRLTSGALIVAKTRIAARALSRALSRGDVGKTYLAVVEGIPADARGEISGPLVTVKGARSHSTVAPEGKEARTTYRVVKTLGGNRTLLEISMHAGRTHQIRAHLASIGHPIVGDKEYGATSSSGGRLLLHAWKLRFDHPVTGRHIAATAKMPDEFRTR